MKTDLCTVEFKEPNGYITVCLCAYIHTYDTYIYKSPLA